MKKTPLSRVNEEFGGKDKLVDQIVGVLERGDEDKEALRKRLQAASNTKLIRLLQAAKQVKELGGKEKLIDAVIAQTGRAKDKDYRTRLEGYTIGRLLDMYNVGKNDGHPGKTPQKKPTTKAKAATKKKGKAA